MSESEYSLHPIGVIRSPLRNRKDAPKQGDEGAPDAWLEISSQVADGLHGIAAGDEIIIITYCCAATKPRRRLNSSAHE
jgi:tRNA (Thr-GGU) A37 N-methylase